MKQSWIVGVVILYLVIVGIEIMYTDPTPGGANFTSIVTSNTSGLIQPSFANTGGISLFTGAASYLEQWVRIFTLTSPFFFEGYMIWFWLFVCLPIDCGMVFGIFMLIRGVSSG